MGLVFRRRKQLRGGRTLNVSKRGASVSQKAGPFTVSTRGRGSMRLGKGFSWRIK